MASNKPKDIEVTEPTAKTVENSPVVETPKAAETQDARPKLAPNQSYTLSGCIRTDN